MAQRRWVAVHVDITSLKNFHHKIRSENLSFFTLPLLIFLSYFYPSPPPLSLSHHSASPSLFTLFNSFNLPLPFLPLSLSLYLVPSSFSVFSTLSLPLSPSLSPLSPCHTPPSLSPLLPPFPLHVLYPLIALDTGISQIDSIL